MPDPGPGPRGDYSEGGMIKPPYCPKNRDRFNALLTLPTSPVELRMTMNVSCLHQLSRQIASGLVEPTKS